MSVLELISRRFSSIEAETNTESSKVPDTTSYYQSTSSQNNVRIFLLLVS